MGKSFTYHVLGYCDAEVIVAMSRVEMVQEMIKLHKRGRGPVKYWRAQTLTGERILGGRGCAEAEEVAPLLPKLPVCAVCGGWGCFCCRHSGVAKRGNERHWRDWQIAYMREKARLEQAQRASA